jgi:UDP-N-acetylglucosamine 2-epimerase (non-hydrolysing)
MGSPSDRPRVMVVVGTRPDAIKLAPVIRALRDDASPVAGVVVATAQHREMLDQVLGLFAIDPDLDLDIMKPSQTLVGVTSRALAAVGNAIEEIEPSAVVIQGDTATALAAALAAFYSKVVVAHVEAGLRSYDVTQPFPEEGTRQLLSIVAGIHFAPTERARRNLLNELVPAEKIVVTGNTVVDALLTVSGAPVDFGGTPMEGLPLDGNRVVVVTSHRRESWGTELENICRAVSDLVERFDDVQVVYPLHMNPNVSGTVRSVLSRTERVHLVPPLDYMSFSKLMRRAFLILTDSGGIQEEAATLRKPLLCLRNLTERPEAFDSGMAKVVGTSREAIVDAAAKLLNDDGAYRAMTSGENPYGDGRAAQRVVEALDRWFRGERQLLEPHREFHASSLEALS